MNIKLSDEECSLRIAAMLEPKPTKEPQIITGEEYDDSPLKCWRFDYHGWDWQPRSMVNDPAMTVMLLEHLAMKGTEPLVDYDAGGWLCMISAVEYPRNPKLGRAVAEAWMLASGYKEQS